VQSGTTWTRQHDQEKEITSISHLPSIIMTSSSSKSSKSRSTDQERVVAVVTGANGCVTMHMQMSQYLS